MTPLDKADVITMVPIRTNSGISRAVTYCTCAGEEAEELATVWVGFRVLQSVFIIPIAEELAFHGYVIHKLVAPDFATVLPGDSLRGLCASCRPSSLACCTADGWQGPSPGSAMRWGSVSAGSLWTRWWRT